MVALVPARGGSKGLPGKNLRPLAGKPLIAHTVAAAKAAKLVRRVVVSTDSPEIAAAAVASGAENPFLRPAELATDTALAIDNYVYTAARLEESGEDMSHFVVLLPTSPLRTSADIDAAISLFWDRGADSVISYYEAPHPVQWHKYLDEGGVLRDYLPQTAGLRNRQDERKAYLPNGAIYVFRHELLRDRRVYYTDRSYPYVMPRSRSIDIDTLEDFEYAEFLLTRSGRVVP